MVKKVVPAPKPITIEVNHEHEECDTEEDCKLLKKLSDVVDDKKEAIKELDKAVKDSTKLPKKVSLDKAVDKKGIAKKAAEAVKNAGKKKRANKEKKSNSKAQIRSGLEIM